MNIFFTILAVLIRIDFCVSKLLLLFRFSYYALTFNSRTHKFIGYIIWEQNDKKVYWDKDTNILRRSVLGLTKHGWNNLRRFLTFSLNCKTSISLLITVIKFHNKSVTWLLPVGAVPLTRKLCCFFLLCLCFLELLWTLQRFILLQTLMLNFFQNFKLAFSLKS